MRLPRDVSGDDLAKALADLGYRVTRQTGSHLRIEISSAQNITLETLVKIARALGRGVEVTFPARRSN